MPINPLGAKLVRYLWIILVTGLMLIAAYVSIGRMVMPRLENYQTQIESVLSERLGMAVSAHSLQGGWQGFQPTARLQQIAIIPRVDEEKKAASDLTIQQIEMQLDVFSSLLSAKPVFASLSLVGIHFDLHQDETGKWSMQGMPKGKGKSNPLRWLLLQEQLLLKNVAFTLHPYQAASRDLLIPEWSLTCGLTVCSSQGSMLLQADADGAVEFGINIYEHPGDEDFRLEGYLTTQPLQLMEWLPLAANLPPQMSDIKGLMLGGEVWFEWANKQLLDVRGSVDVPEIQLASEHEALTAIDFLHTDFTWQRHTDDEDELWALSLSDLTFKWAGKVFEPAQRRISLLQTEQGRVARLLADRVELQPITSTLLALNSLSPKIRDVLADLRPSGQLRNVHFDYPLDKTSENAGFKLQAELNNVTVSAWKGAPKLVAVNGYLEADPLGGQVDFDTQNLSLQFPKLFSDIWLFKRARGVVSWQREGNAFWLDGKELLLQGEIGDVTGQFSFVNARGEFEPRLSLLMGLENSRLPDAMTFVPDRAIKPKMGEWLAQAFSKGTVKYTRFVLDQALVKGAAETARTLVMSIDAEDVDFSYHPDWPQLTQADVSVKVDGQQVSVTAESARFYDLQLQQIVADYRVGASGARLKANAGLHGGLKDAWRIVTETPLQKNMFALADDFQFDGQMRGRLSLDLPFKSLQKSNVELAFKTPNASLKIPSLSVSASAIDGAFNYSTINGLTAADVKARMFGNPIALNIASQKNAVGVATQFDMQGHLQVSSLAPWVPPLVLTNLAGETDFSAQLDIGRGSKNQLQVSSDLGGVSVTLPEPFTKPAQQTSSFSFKLGLDQSQLHTLQYADKFSYSLHFRDKGYQDGTIIIGAGVPRYRAGKGIQASGEMPMLDFEQWQQLVEQAQTMVDANATSTGSNVGAGQESLLSKITDVTLKVGKFKFLDTNYDQVAFTAKQQQGDWQVAFSNAVAKGVLDYYPVSQKPLAVDFDYLRLPAEPELDTAAEKTSPAKVTKKDALSTLVPQQLPELDLTIKQLFLGKETFGSWAFNSRRNDTGVKLEQLVFELRGVQGSGELDWMYNKGVHSSLFRGDIRIPDVAEMLRGWKLSTAMEGKNARFSGQVNWPGSPSQFSLLTMQGPLTMQAEEGRVVDLQSLPLLGILNFDTLTRRLRLDFSDLFKKGFSFDEAKGGFQFERGKMLFTQPLVVDGPSAKFKIEGQTDLLNEQFNHDVIVVLPVNDNISVATTLAGLPQVGIPLYLFNRAFGGVLDRFTSINYLVTGPWDNPKVELNSFFDTDDLKGDKKSKKKRRAKR